jgi:hypothetical protein
MGILTYKNIIEAPVVLLVQIKDILIKLNILKSIQYVQVSR